MRAEPLSELKMARLSPQIKPSKLEVAQIQLTADIIIELSDPQPRSDLEIDIENEGCMVEAVSARLEYKTAAMLKELCRVCCRFAGRCVNSGTWATFDSENA